MSVRVLFDPELSKAALYDSVGEVAFGPLFESVEEATAFLDWLADRPVADARGLAAGALGMLVAAFREADAASQLQLGPEDA